MTAMAPIIHALLVGADNLEKVVDELPESVCREQRLMLCALARAAVLTAEQLQQEQLRLERKLLEPVA